jgi:hypothetical protein
MSDLEYALDDDDIETEFDEVTEVCNTRAIVQARYHAEDWESPIERMLIEELEESERLVGL